MNQKPILVAGATGYVAGRLIPALLGEGYRVRAVTRSVKKTGGRPWSNHPNLQWIRADVLDKASLSHAARGCSAAYYLVHSMIARKHQYADADRVGAQHMVEVAEAEGIDRIIYLGGLGEQDHPRISPHLRSRHEVGRVLSSGKVPVTILRAAMILGSGSASFEILRYLVERLPVMLTPKWVDTPSQPIAIGNVVHYLVRCLTSDQLLGGTFDIGGPEVMTYKNLIDLFARTAHLPKRRVLPVPVLSPGLSARWIHLVTPVPAAIALPLTQGLSIPTTCIENRIREIIPQRLITCEEAMQNALAGKDYIPGINCPVSDGQVTAEWAADGDAAWANGTVFQAGFRSVLSTPVADVWEEIRKIGGGNGYFFADWLWKIRGFLDKLAGGRGLQAGIRRADPLQVGDTMDFWRILTIEPLRRLVLAAEMKMPGEATMEIQLDGRKDGTTQLSIISRFIPRGLGGICYWYFMYPAHYLVFRGMLTGVGKKLNARMIHGPESFPPESYGTCPMSLRA
ncbi:MAG: SDR family oxidoreductase [Desulfobacteraceae bacterium]|nr:SDR family oxidoreductase [Desulfobacteraceae bacterium]